MYSLTVFGLGLAALCYGVLALYLSMRGYVRPPLSRAGLALVAAVALTSLWALVSLAGLGTAWGWWWSALLDVCRYGAWFAFLVCLLRSDSARHLPGPQRPVQATRWFTSLALLLPLLALLALLAAAWTAMSSATGLKTVFFAILLLAVFGLVLLEQLFRNLPEDAAWSAKPICLGLAGTFVYDLYLFSQVVLFQSFDADAFHVRGLVHAALMPLLLLSTTRHRNWIDKIRVSRQLVFHSATLLLVGGYLLFIAAVGYFVRHFGGDWGRALQLALFFLALVGLLALAWSGSFRARVRVLLGKHFFRYRYDYRQEWLKFTQVLSSQSEPQEMGLRVIRGLADMLESPAGALWLRDPDEPCYRQVARWNMPPSEAAEPLDSALMSFMRRSGWVVNMEEYRSRPERYDSVPLSDWLAVQTQAWLLVPLWLGQDLLGFVVLGRARAPMEVNWEVTDLLKTAGRQAASFLAQMQATEALLEARKFEAFSRMSAFVVHDLKNIVTQLSLMMKNAKRLSHKPEFQADMLLTVENALERMRQLMLQLREGASPGGTAVGVDLGRIAHGLAASAQSRGRLLELDLEPRVAARGHAERLERVLWHLVSNALEASSAQQRVWLRIQRRGSHACVEVGDNGVGMSEEFVQQRLFKPFQTTKETGMGIGAFESFQYVQELGGKVSVHSQQGAGTLVTLLLPLFDSLQASDLQQLGQA